MKILITIIFCFFISLTSAQTTNKIRKVKELNIYGKGAKVIIGKVIINSTLVTKILLLKSTQQLDSAGYYVTRFYLGNNETVPLFGVNILLKFDKKVLDVNFKISSAMGFGFGMQADSASYLFRASTVNRDMQDFTNPTVITFVIKSKEKIFTTLNGIDGILP